MNLSVKNLLIRPRITPDPINPSGTKPCNRLLIRLETAMNLSEVGC